MSQESVDSALTAESMAAGPAESEPDFATEHCRVTFSDQLEGGLERSRDPDSPRGLAGADDRFGRLFDG